MAKKLFFAVFFSACLAFSSISIYADVPDNGEENDVREKVKQVKLTIANAEKVTAELAESSHYTDGLAAYIQHINENVSDKEAKKMAECFVEYGEKYNVDEKLVMAIAHTESTYYSDAVSYADYKGLMQTGDVLAEEAGYTPQQLFNPEVSIKVGASYIGEKLEEFGDTKLALTAYNQGSGSVYSGNYTTGYAELAMARAEAVEAYLTENGYMEYRDVE